MKPHLEQLKHLSIFGRKFDSTVPSFNEAAIESSVEISRIEAENALEDHERSLVAADSNVDLDASVEHIAGRVSTNWRTKYGVCTHLVGNLSGVDGGAIVTTVD